MAGAGVVFTVGSMRLVLSMAASAVDFIAVADLVADSTVAFTTKTDCSNSANYPGQKTLAGVISN